MAHAARRQHQRPLLSLQHTCLASDGEATRDRNHTPGLPRTTNAALKVLCISRSSDGRKTGGKYVKRKKPFRETGEQECYHKAFQVKVANENGKQPWINVNWDTKTQTGVQRTEEVEQEENGTRCRCGGVLLCSEARVTVYKHAKKGERALHSLGRTLLLPTFSTFLQPFLLVFRALFSRAEKKPIQRSLLSPRCTEKHLSAGMKQHTTELKSSSVRVSSVRRKPTDTLYKPTADSPVRRSAGDGGRTAVRRAKLNPPTSRVHVPPRQACGQQRKENFFGEGLGARACSCVTCFSFGLNRNGGGSKRKRDAFELTAEASSLNGLDRIDAWGFRLRAPPPFSSEEGTPASGRHSVAQQDSRTLPWSPKRLRSS